MKAELLTGSLGQALEFFLFIGAELLIVLGVVSVLLGVLDEFVPAARIRRIMSGARRGNIVGAGLGAMTPFCGCSTIPVTMGLLNAGAPFGATMSFLLASPVLNPILLSLFVVLFGWQPALVYAVFAFALAVVGGNVWEKLGLQRYLKQSVQSCGAAASEAPRARLARIGAYAARTFRSFLPYLLIGAAVGALIYGFVPQDILIGVAGPDEPLAVPASAALGVPLYVRASTMLSVGAALVDKGMSMGAVMALVIAGAGASLPEMILLSGIFKKQLMAIFVLTVFTTAIVAGYAFNLFFF